MTEEIKNECFRLGFNYWPRKTNIKMWKEWDEEEVICDLKQLKSLGANSIRAFALDQDFVDPYGNINEKSMAKLGKFLDLSGECGIGVRLTFLVGHMSGRNWYIPWAPNNDLYSPESINGFLNFVSTIVKQYKSHKAIEGWIMSNEMTLVKKPSNKEEALSIARSFYETVKRIDPVHPITSGDVISSLQDPTNIYDVADYSGLHIYFYDNDLVRHRYAYGSLINIYQNNSEIGAFLEEFGFSTNQVSEDSQKNFIYSTLWTSLINGAIGSYIWCFSDFPDYEDPPYNWRPLEINFGVVRKDGTEKPSATMFRQFSDEIKKLNLNSVSGPGRFSDSRVSVMIPFFAYGKYPFVPEEYTIKLFGRLPNQFTSSIQLSKMSGYRPTALYENNLIKFRAEKKFLLFPSVPVLLSETWNFLERSLEKDELSIYMSTFRGLSYNEFSISSYHDSLTPSWEKIFGVNNELKAGEKGVKYNGNINLKFIRKFGDIKQDETIELPLDNLTLYSYRLGQGGADVIALDQHKEIVLTKNMRMRSIFCSIPLELIYSISENDICKKNIIRIYRNIFKETGLNTSVWSEDPRIEVVENKETNPDITIIAVNHSEEYIETLIHFRAKNPKVVAGNSSILNSTEAGVYVSFPPGGVIVLRNSA
jgi:endo-1,4-beta-mannosidase